ncbi:hypothetical protein NECAME_17014 [Necator americanus]|uniref:Uncharacterized protein n=1 Tax=Necator americanus TaxID=51031 RepID=W2TUR7_NECAM|nr:hypothetical protein NECAME_17014 [Necator americanus]ETN84772.1 hypothetical protein NECAME_17014 [Necator americanus]
MYPFKFRNIQRLKINVLSPSLFSLHDKGNGIEKMTSLTTLLNSTGVLKERDQQEWMDFIIETSGAADAFDEAKATKRKEEAKTDVKKIRGPDGQPIILTKENVTKLYGKYEASKVNLFEQLQNSFTPEQLLAMNRTGYAVLSPPQRVLVYGENSPFNNSIALETMRNVTDYDAHRTVRDTVRHVAAGRLRLDERGMEIVKTLINPQNSSIFDEDRQIPESRIWIRGGLVP